MIANPIPTAADVEHALPAGLGNIQTRKPIMRRFVTRRKLLVAVLLVPVIAGGVWLAFGGASRGQPKDTLPPPSGLAQRDAGTVMVTAEPVGIRRVERIVEAVGTLHAFEDVTISARVDGRVKRILRDTADRVKPGAVLLQIDPTIYQAAVSRQEALLASSQSGLVQSKATLDQAQRALTRQPRHPSY